MTRFRRSVAPRLVYVAPLLMAVVTLAVLTIAENTVNRYWQRQIGGAVVPLNWLLATLGASVTGAFADGSLGKRVGLALLCGLAGFVLAAAAYVGLGWVLWRLGLLW